MQYETNLATPYSSPDADRSAEYSWRSRSVKALASVALLSTLTSCSTPNTSEQIEPRNAPASANYSRDVNPSYYDNLKAAQSYAPGDDQERLAELEKQAVAEWLPADAELAADRITLVRQKTRQDRTIPVFVSYAIPNRDLGNQSAGGLDAKGYTTYINAVSRAINQSPTIVVVEPDALAHLPDSKLSADQRAERVSLLADTLDVLRRNSRTAVYLDAGNSAWRSPSETADLLREVAKQTEHGIPGISLNVSNFRSTEESEAYARNVESAYGHKFYTLIDTSRNGDPQAAAYQGPDAWCNPPNQRVGQADALFDARAAIEEIFIKTPGESDGDCNQSTKPAGEFDGDLLLEQLR